MSETPYKNGKKIGGSRFFYMTGELDVEYPGENGVEKRYYKNGNLKQEVTYKNSKAIEGYKYTAYGLKTKMTNAHIYNINMSHDKIMKKIKERKKKQEKDKNIKK